MLSKFGERGVAEATLIQGEYENHVDVHERRPYASRRWRRSAAEVVSALKFGAKKSREGPAREERNIMIRHRRLSGIAGAIVLLVASGIVRAQRGAAPSDNPDRWLTGAIDIHVHSSPDTVERSVDAVEAAMMARVHHMRAIVLKNHYDSTAPFVTLVRKLVPGIEIYGGIDLNLPVGGMNAAAVEHMTQILGGAGRFVWMSTYDAENQVRFSKENRPFVGLSKDRRAAPDDEGCHRRHREARTRARDRTRIGRGRAHARA